MNKIKSCDTTRLLVKQHINIKMFVGLESMHPILALSMDVLRKSCYELKFGAILTNSWNFSSETSQCMAVKVT